MNTKRLLFFGCVMTAFFLIAPSHIHAEQINDFGALYVIHRDGSVDAIETINYDFGTRNRHGIYRTIPFIKTNNEGKHFALMFDTVEVANPAGAAYQFVRSDEGNEMKLKIGDPDTTITGEHTFIIRYGVVGALTYFSDHDEFYWNVTGNDWKVGINRVNAEVMLPKEIPMSEVTAACFTGAAGATDQNCVARKDAGKVRFSTSVPLAAGEGMSIVVGFPRDIVAVREPTPIIGFFDTPLGKIVRVIVIVLGAAIGLAWYFALPVWIIRQWYQFGRDPKPAMGVASAWFEPPKTKTGRYLTPGETGTLIDEYADMKDITATIIDLARRGYIMILEPTKNDFHLIKRNDYTHDSSLQPFERELLEGLFKNGELIKVKDSEIIDTVSRVKMKLYAAVVDEKLFEKSPEKVRTIYMVIAGVALFTGNLWLAIIAFFFGRAMPRKTVEGAQAAIIAKSLKNFLTSQERMLTSQAKDQVFFEKLLPYAVAFGVEKIWATRFKDIDMKQPDWYDSYNSRAFSSIYFANSLHHASLSFTRAATPTLSSRGFSSGFGGGSSGGGGGGGGGGSW